MGWTVDTCGAWVMNEYRNSFFTVSYMKAGVTEGDIESVSNML